MSGISSYGGISGLASGMNTQDIVEQMLGNTQAKIDRQNALKQQNVWRQQIYREMLSSISSFQNKYFSFSSPTTNLLSHSLFNTMTAIASSDAVKVTGSSNASSGKMTIQEVTQLATNTKQQSSVDVTNEVTGKLNMSKLKREVEFSVDGTKKTITIEGKTQSEIVSNLNTELQKEFGTDVSAKMSGGKLVISHTDATKEVKVTGGALLGTSLLGVSIGQEGKGKIETNIDMSKATVNLAVSLDGSERNISIDVAGIKDKNDLIKEINLKLNNAFGGTVKAELDSNDNVTFKTVKTDGTVDDSRHLVINGDRAILDTLGLKAGDSNKINFNTKLSDANFKTLVQGTSYGFTINGVKIEGSTNETIGDLVNKINGSGAGVRVTYSSFSDKFTIETSASGAGSNIDISQESGNVLSALFGVTSGNKAESNTLHVNSLTGSSNFDVNSLKNGGDFSIKVNGKEITVEIPKNIDSSGKEIDHTVDSFVKELNKELRRESAGITFEVSNNQVTMKNKDQHEVEFLDNSLSKGLGFSKGTTTKVKSTTSLADVGLNKGTITVNGQDINLANTNTMDDLVGEIDKALKLNNNNGSARFNSNTGEIEINGGNGSVSITAKAGDADAQKAMESLFGSENLDFNKAVTGATSEVTTTAITNGSGNATSTTTLKDAGLDKGVISFMGTNVDLSKLKGANGQDATINDLVAELDKIAKSIDKEGSVTFDSTTGKISIKGVNGHIKGIDTDGTSNVNKLFGKDTIDISSNGLTLIQSGQNSSFKMNGIVYERNSNVIEIDGITVELLKTSADEINITTTRDTTRVVDAVKGFVEDYNKLIDELHKIIGEEPNYKDYPPLTDAQRKEMSESEIKLWEEKAKEGLVRNDSAVSSLLSGMRSILYTKPDGAKYALFDLGITTGSWKDNGKLVMEDPPTELLKAIEKDPQEIQKLFTDASQGLAVKLKDVLDNATKSGRPNSLVDIAGHVGSPNDSSLLGRQINEYEKALTNLRRKYTLEERRYWKQFNAMEQAIASMNQQSAFLMQQTAM